MAKKQIKIEELAVMIKRGFDSMATKEDLKMLVTKAELQELRKEMATKEDLRWLATKAELQELRKEMATKAELQELRKEMATKENLKMLATKAELQELRKETLEGFRLIHDDLHDIKITIGPLVRMVAALNNEIANLRTRVERLEKRIGVGK